MKFSMMTYTLMRQGGFTPADCVRVAAELKMEGIDWVTTYGEDPVLLRKMSEDAGLTVAAHTFFLRVKEEGETLLSVAERSLDNACILGAPLVMIPPCPVAGVESREENHKVWCERLADVMVLAKKRNLTVTVENFPGALSPFVPADDFYKAKELFPDLRLTFDNGNAATGEDHIASLKRCIKDVAHVHLKDWDRSESAVEGMRQMLDGAWYAPALIGEGVIDSVATCRVLKENGYDGFINIEYENNKYRADEGVKKVLEFLRGAL